jgi:CSLREA domain-containing protein
LFSETSRRSILRAFSIAAAMVFVIAVVGLTAIRAVHASARVSTVNTTTDGDQGTGTTCGSPAAAGWCTLRSAIELADRESGDTIVLPPGIYDLDPHLGGLGVTSSMTITGAGSATTIVDGGQATGVFGVDAAASASITGLTIRNGAVTDQNAFGAGIASDGTLSLTDVIVTGGSVPKGSGGGIASDGPLTLSNVIISGNNAGDGGGLVLLGTAKTSISRSTISGNSADGIHFGSPGLREVQFPGTGGGILLAGDGGSPPRLAITSSTISGNIVSGPASLGEGATFPEGGGIFNLSGVMSLANDTVAGNAAVLDDTSATSARAAGRPTLFAVGGGIAQSGSNAVLPVSGARTNSPRRRLGALVSGLVAELAAGRAPALSPPATVAPTPAPTPPPSVVATSLDFVTLAGNSAGLFGGIATLAGTFSVANTIVAGNAGANCGNPGFVTSMGFNIDSADDCGFRQTGDQVNTNPNLDGPKLNAPGVTATMALLPGSPAIDAANPRCDQNTDQRGVTRPQGARCDIGAFEVEQPATTKSPPSPPVTGMRATASIHTSPVAVGVLMLLVVLAALGAGLALKRSRSA